MSATGREPCPAPYYPPHKLCKLCGGTGVISAELLATLETRPFPATYDSRGTLLYPAGRELTGRRIEPGALPDHSDETGDLP